MLFSIIKSPKSQRSNKLDFKGFLPQGRNKIEKLFKTYIRFFRALFGYFLKKIKVSLVLTKKLGLFMNWFFRESKAFMIKKLIWSRGKLGRPVANSIVMATAFMVFMFGSVFSSSKFVNSQEVEKDYLRTTSDIIPVRTVATTTLPEERQRTEPLLYTVVGGDTLSGIGEKFKISVDAIKYVNSLTDSSILKIGQEIVIPPASGLTHKVKSGETIASIAEKYGVASQAIADFNYILDTKSLVVGTELVIPDAKIPQPVISVPVQTQFAINNGRVVAPTGGGWCIWPTTVRIITQYFSWYHNGLDIATPWNIQPPLFACGNGIVTRAGWDPWGLGLHIIIDHGNGFETVYGHMSRIDVGVGAEVGQGDTIGVMGNTGRSTGPHVHFIVKFNGVAQDPLNYIQ